MTLDVIIATYKPDGIERVAAMLLPPREDVRYVVSWQAHGNAPLPPKIAERDDVMICRADSIGLSANRNNALENVTADIVYILDDDIEICSDAFDSILTTFAENPEVDIATFKSERGVIREFPSTPTDLKTTLPKNYYVVTFEIALRRRTAGFHRFCTAFGVGAKRFLSGEEELFLHSAIRKGLCCRFFPILICRHPHSTTAERRQTPGTLRAIGAIIALVTPVTAVLRIPLKVYRLWRENLASPLTALYYIIDGALSVPTLRRTHRDTLW